MKSLQKSASSMFGEGVQTVKENPIILLFFIVITIPGLISELPENSNMIVFVTSMISFVGTIGVHGAIHVEHDNRRNNKRVNIVNRVSSRLLTLLLITLIYAMSVFIGLLLLIIPGIYIGVKLYPSFAIAVIENEGVLNSLEKSWNYTSGSFWTIFGIYIILVLLLISSTIIGALMIAIFGALTAGIGFFIGAIVLFIVVSALELAAEGAIADFVVEQN